MQGESVQGETELNQNVTSSISPIYNLHTNHFCTDLPSFHMETSPVRIYHSQFFAQNMLPVTPSIGPVIKALFRLVRSE